MNQRKNDFRTVKNLAYAWDKGPLDYINLNNRIFLHYGKQYIDNKIDFASGNFDNFYFEPRFKHLLTNTQTINENQQNNDLYKMNVEDMTIPTSEYENWLHSISSKDIEKYEQKKILLDKYLNQYPPEDRQRIKQAMLTNETCKNYVKFMDLDPNLMTVQQFVIYKDIVKFYDLENYLAFENNQKLWNYFNEVNSAYNQERVENIGIRSQDINVNESQAIQDLVNQNNDLKTQIEINNNLINEIKQDKESLSLDNNFNRDVYNKTLINTLYKANKDSSHNSSVNMSDINNNITNKSLLEIQAKLDLLNKQLLNQRQLTQDILNQQNINKEIKLNDSNSVNYEKIKPMMFNPETSMYSSKWTYGVNNQYNPISKTSSNIIPRNIILSNPSIATSSYVTNIADLIQQRDQILMNNNKLVNEIIQKQIDYNNQFLSNNNVNINIPQNPNNNSSLSNDIITTNSSNNNEVIANNKPISLSVIKNKQANNIFETNKNNNIESSDNKPISLSSILNKNKSASNETASNNFLNNNIKINNFVSHTNNTNNQAVDNKLKANVSNKSPVQTIRPYKPNLANAIKKVSKPTDKHFNKLDFEPSNESKQNLNEIYNKQQTINNKTTNVETNETTQKTQIKSVIPSKKII